jgi:hypothetical protein
MHADNVMTCHLPQGATSVQRTFRVAMSAIGAAGLLSTGLLAAPAIAAPAHHSSAASRTAQLPLSARQMLADRELHSRRATATGSLTGAARSANGQPLADICVLAYGPSGRSFAATRPDGQFFMTGLKPGIYHLRYFGCGNTAAYQSQWYGGAARQAGSRPVMVTGSALRPLPPVTMRTVAARSVTANVINPASPVTAAKSIATSLGLPMYGKSVPAIVAAPRGGHIAGVVTDPAGHGLKGICVQAFSVDGFGASLVKTGKTGHYHTGSLPPGSYDVIFYADCGNTGNWLVQVYKGMSTVIKPTSVPVSRGKTTSGIKAKMELGGEISGTVTGTSGAKLSGICVFPLQAGQPNSLILAAMSVHGTYHLRGLPRGAYKLDFTPCGPASIYAPIWWPHSETPGTAKTIRLKPRQIVSGINVAMPVGGVISGTVTDASNKVLPGICVAAVPNSQFVPASGFPFTSTNAAGQYSIAGLSAGKYQVQFSLGCGNNGNYISANYPSLVAVNYGQVAAGINVQLPTGTTLSGVVTSAASGQPKAGICVQVTGDQNTNFFNPPEVTKADGSYTFDQMPPGTYFAQFSGGCGNAGSFAPQAYNNTSIFTPQPIIVSKPAETITGINAAMQPGATLSGTVLGSGGSKLTGMCVFASFPGFFGGFEANSFNGRFWMPNLLPGDYQVSFSPGCPSNANLVPVSFGSQSNPPFVSAPAGITTGIDGVLPTAGSISGVFVTKSGNPVPQGCISVAGLTAATQAFFGGNTSMSGRNYKITQLLPGPYQVIFQPGCGSTTNYENQWYKDKPSPAGAARVQVRAGHTTTGINSALVRGGSIAGTVTSSGRPVGNACVFAQNVNQFLDFGTANTGKTGKYIVPGLNPGEYELSFFPCGQGAATLAEGLLTRLVKVTGTARTSGVNFSLSVGGRITGTVEGGSPVVAQPGVCVEAFQTNGFGTGFALTDQGGSFTMRNLPAGKYLVFIGDPGCALQPDNLAPQWYLNASTPATATLVTVTQGATTKLASVTLSTNGGISGTVTGSGNAAIAGICVTATSPSAVAPVLAVTRAAGTYSVLGLTPGTYTVEFSSGCGASGYRTQWWDGKGAQRNATPISVTADTTTAGISATMTK